MYKIIVSSKNVIEHADKPGWTSPEWTRIWQIGSKRAAERRVKELKKRFDVQFLSVTKRGKVEVVNV